MTTVFDQIVYLITTTPTVENAALSRKDAEPDMEIALAKISFMEILGHDGRHMHRNAAGRTSACLRRVPRQKCGGLDTAMSLASVGPVFEIAATRSQE